MMQQPGNFSGYSPQAPGLAGMPAIPQAQMKSLALRGVQQPPPVVFAGKRLGVPKESGDIEMLINQVVKIYCTSMDPKPSQPWQTGHQDMSTSSGFFVKVTDRSGCEMLAIMTNAHAVDYDMSVSVRKHGGARKYRAKVLARANELDLALVGVAEPEFWQGINPVKFANLPEYQDHAVVIGFPLGGDSVSVTNGVVSRIDVIHYSHGSKPGLSIQTDAAINHGNSGGPMFVGDEVVGVAFECHVESQGIGYAIPARVVQHFMDDYTRYEQYSGYHEIGIHWIKIENPAMRQYLGMSKKHHGILVTMVPKASPVALYLRAYDVILSVDGFEMADDGTVELADRHGERVNWLYLFASKSIGDQVKLKILRKGVEYVMTTDLVTEIGLVPAHLYKKCSWYVFAGFVFLQLSVELLYKMRSIG
eukprot:846933_1